MSELVAIAPAKVNLYLGVGSLRQDGYHEVTTVMHALELADVLRIRSADELTVTSDRDLGIPMHENLAFRAARAFSATFEVDVLVDIAIEKHVPAGAGLGGGSSDAAAVLAALAHWAGLSRDHALLKRAARSLGADCAFLLQDGPAIMCGRGDEFEQSLPPLAAHIVVVKPAASVPTAAAYRAFDSAPQPAGAVAAVADALRCKDVAALAAALGNNMTAASEALVPEIGGIRRWLGGQDGVLGMLMAGSGSAVFAVCEDETGANRAADAARARGWWSVATRTRAHGVTMVEGEGPA